MMKSDIMRGREMSKIILVELMKYYEISKKRTTTYCKLYEPIYKVIKT